MEDFQCERDAGSVESPAASTDKHGRKRTDEKSWASSGKRGKISNRRIRNEARPLSKTSSVVA